MEGITASYGSEVVACGSRVLEPGGRYGFVCNVADGMADVVFADGSGERMAIKTLVNLPKTIDGRMEKQVWQGDNAMSIGEAGFDATDYVLSLTAEAIQKVTDCDYTSDYIGMALVDHDGPCEVYIEEAINSYFGVLDLSALDADRVEQARALHTQQFKAELDQKIIGERVDALKSEITKLLNKAFQDRPAGLGDHPQGLESLRSFFNAEFDRLSRFSGPAEK